jgi:DNA-3-methyladenine glycosylase II
MADDPYDHLAAEDPVLSGLVRRYGRPDPFVRSVVDDVASTNFAALVLHVVSQQVSTRVALTLFRRVEQAAGGPLDPRRVVGLGGNRLHELGLSRAKATAVVGLAELHLAGALDTAHLDALADDDAIAALTAARGVGPWTAQMFLIHQLRRPDVLPAGDLGIRHAVRTSWSLPELPPAGDVQIRGRQWAPYRTYAAALLWSSLRLAAGDDDTDRDCWDDAEGTLRVVLQRGGGEDTDDAVQPCREPTRSGPRLRRAPDVQPRTRRG